MSRRGTPISTKLALLLGSILLALAFSAWAQQSNATEDQVKAAYLLNFAKLSEWPGRALPEGSAPLVIGVSGGDDDFLNILKTIVAGKTNGSHPFAVRSITSGESMKSCQVIFFRTSEKKQTPASLEELAHASILLVGEDPSFLQQGGMINLVRDHGKIRFEVNSEALGISKVSVNAKVLSLAKATDTPSSSAPSDTSASSEGGRKLEISGPPAYPAMAQQMKLTGTARVQALVKPNGTVQEVTILGGHPILAAALAEAVRGWKYQPAPRETTEIIKFNFAPQ
jgi:TonB family protein